MEIPSMSKSILVTTKFEVNHHDHQIFNSPIGISVNIHLFTLRHGIVGFIEGCA